MKLLFLAGGHAWLAVVVLGTQPGIIRQERSELNQHAFSGAELHPPPSICMHLVFISYFCEHGRPCARPVSRFGPHCCYHASA
jgi:hypothetical protein